MEALQYICERCGSCCRIPGVVRVSEAECNALAAFLGLSIDDFMELYTRLLPDRSGLSLVSKTNHECVFLEDSLCHVQVVKPAQCSGFPHRWNYPGWQTVCPSKMVS